jgi:predicted permease
MERQRSFESAAALSRRVVTLAGGGEPERVQVGSASASLFPMLGVTPALGRTFSPDEDDRVDAVVLLSHELWQRRFGGDPDVVGTSVRLSDAPYTVIGVLPEDFRLLGFESDAWFPLGGPPAENMRDNHSLKVLGRLASGVTIEAAQAETASLLDAVSPESHMTQHGARLAPRVADITGDVRQPLVLLIVAAGLLLAVSCASVAAVLLGAGIDRAEELTVRAALGATRGRLAVQLLTESVALAVIGGVLGVLLARLALDGLVLLAPPGIPRIDEVGLDGRIVALAIAVSALCGLTFGMVPALALSGPGSRPAPGTRVTGGRARLQSAIVVGELALATLLLVSAGLLTRTMVALENVDPGFTTDGVLTVRVAHSWPRFQHDSTGEALTAYMDDIGGALGGLPGVRDVAMTSVLPYSGDRATNAIVVEGYTPAPGEVIDVERNFVSWNYLEVMDIPITRGRSFTPADDRRDAEPVAVVSERLAARFWPDVDPVGRSFGFWDTTFRVIGVAADVRDSDLAQDARMEYYVARRPLGFGSGSFVLRVDGDPVAYTPAVRARVWSVDPELPITSIAPLQDRVEESIAAQRYRMRLITIFALLSAVFALLGVYGVTSRWVARRTPELGVRVALGAPRRRVLGLVLGNGVRLAVAGAIVGIAASLVATRLLASFLFGVRPNDAVTLGAIVLLLFAMTLIATLAPARRAARIDPMRALRSD